MNKIRLKARTFFLISLSLILFFCISGCIIDEKPDVIEYFPLEVGNSWVYEGYGNEYASFTRELIYAKGSLYQTTEDNGGTVSSNVYLLSDESVEIVYSLAEDYGRGNALDKPSNKSEIILKAPIEPGNKWFSSGFSYEIVSVNETVMTPAGTMDACIKVRIIYTDPGIETYHYYCRDIGLVRTEFISGDIMISSSLSSYTVN